LGVDCSPSRRLATINENDGAPESPNTTDPAYTGLPTFKNQDRNYRAQEAPSSSLVTVHDVQLVEGHCDPESTLAAVTEVEQVRPDPPSEQYHSSLTTELPEDETRPVKECHHPKLGRRKLIGSTAILFGLALIVVVPTVVVITNTSSTSSLSTPPSLTSNEAPHLFAVAQAEEDLSIFVKAMESVEGNLLWVLQEQPEQQQFWPDINMMSNASAAPFTVLAPTNAAFDKLNQELLEKFFTPPWSAHMAVMLYNQFFTPALQSMNLTDGLVVYRNRTSHGDCPESDGICFSFAVHQDDVLVVTAFLTDTFNEI